MESVPLVGPSPSSPDSSSDCDSSSCGLSSSCLGLSVSQLHYSSSEILSLASRAELLVLGRLSREGDSDYSSQHCSSLQLLGSEEPELKRRGSPKRRQLASRRREWRSSLPECLEFYHTTTPQGREGSSDSEGELQGRLSAPPLSELWEEEQCQSEQFAWSEEEQGDGGALPSLLSFGEDYGRYLRRREDSDSSGGEGKEGGRREDSGSSGGEGRECGGRDGKDRRSRGRKGKELDTYILKLEDTSKERKLDTTAKELDTAAWILNDFSKKKAKELDTGDWSLDAAGKGQGTIAKKKFKQMNSFETGSEVNKKLCRSARRQEKGARRQDKGAWVLDTASKGLDTASMGLDIAARRQKTAAKKQETAAKRMEKAAKRQDMAVRSQGTAAKRQGRDLYSDFGETEDISRVKGIALKTAARRTGKKLDTAARELDTAAKELETAARELDTQAKEPDTDASKQNTSDMGFDTAVRRLEDISRSMKELQQDDPERLSLVCLLKQELGSIYRSLEQEQERLLAPPGKVVESEGWWRWGVSSSLWWRWGVSSSLWWRCGVSSSLLLLSLLSLAALLASSLTPRCCSDYNSLAWSILSNPLTLNFVNGPPPI